MSSVENIERCYESEADRTVGRKWSALVSDFLAVGGTPPVEAAFADFAPKTELVRKLLALRTRFQAAGGQFQSAEEIQAELDASRNTKT